MSNYCYAIGCEIEGAHRHPGTDDVNSVGPAKFVTIGPSNESTPAERRRYALYECAGKFMTDGWNMEVSIDRATTLLEEIERREK